MDKVNFLQLLFLVLITCVKLNQSFNIRFIVARKDSKQTNLNPCAADFLFKTDYVGVRMENETGACEALSSDLATHEEIMDKAYAYAYRLQIGQFYQPPLEYKGHTLTLPGIFESGAQLEVTAIRPPHQATIYIGLHDDHSRDLMHFNINGTRMILDEHNSTLQWQRQRLLGYFDDFADGKLFKLLYVVEGDFIKAYLNGKEIVPGHDPIFPINSIRRLVMSSEIDDLPFVGLKFKHKTPF